MIERVLIIDKVRSKLNDVTQGSGSGLTASVDWTIGGRPLIDEDANLMS